MTISDQLDAKLEDLEDRAAYFIGKHGSRYADIYDRLWWVRWHPDAEPRGYGRG